MAGSLVVSLGASIELFETQSLGWFSKTYPTEYSSLLNGRLLTRMK